MLALDVPHLSLPWDWNMHPTVFLYICLPVGQIQSSKTSPVIAEQETQFSKNATRAGKGQQSYFSLCNPLFHQSAVAWLVTHQFNPFRKELPPRSFSSNEVTITINRNPALEKLLEISHPTPTPLGIAWRMLRNHLAPAVVRSD